MRSISHCCKRRTVCRPLPPNLLSIGRTNVVRAESRLVGADGYLRIARRSPLHFEEQRARLEEEGVAVSDTGFVAPEFFAGAAGEGALRAEG